MLEKGDNVYVVKRNNNDEIIDICSAKILRINKTNIRIDNNDYVYDLNGICLLDDGCSLRLSMTTSELTELKKEFDYNEKFNSLYISIKDRYRNLPKPNRFLNIGDISSRGKVLDVLDEGDYYLIQSGESKKDINIYPWIYIWIKEDNFNFEFGSRDGEKISFYNQQLETLLFKAYCEGINFDVDYQREYVWGDEDKVDLIHSIFNHIEIGKFVFIETLEEYEILDGKQRLTTLLEFHQDKFKYRGKYFSELSVRDKNYFLGFNVSVGEVSNLTRLQKLNYFRKLNSKGIVMSKEHLNKIDEMIDDEMNQISTNDI